MSRSVIYFCVIRNFIVETRSNTRPELNMSILVNILTFLLKEQKLQ